MSLYSNDGTKKKQQIHDKILMYWTLTNHADGTMQIVVVWTDTFAR